MTTVALHSPDTETRRKLTFSSNGAQRARNRGKLDELPRHIVRYSQENAEEAVKLILSKDHCDISSIAIRLWTIPMHRTLEKLLTDDGNEQGELPEGYTDEKTTRAFVQAKGLAQKKSQSSSSSSSSCIIKSSLRFHILHASTRPSTQQAQVL